MKWGVDERIAKWIFAVLTLILLWYLGLLQALRDSFMEMIEALQG
jgi:hypothetical protein